MSITIAEQSNSPGDGTPLATISSHADLSFKYTLRTDQSDAYPVYPGVATGNITINNILYDDEGIEETDRFDGPVSYSYPDPNFLSYPILAFNQLEDGKCQYGIYYSPVVFDATITDVHAGTSTLGPVYWDSIPPVNGEIDADTQKLNGAIFGIFDPHFATVNRTATYAIPYIPAGSGSVTVSWSLRPANANMVPTKTYLVAEPNPQLHGLEVVFIAAAVPASGGGIPTGTYTFSVDGVSAAVVALDANGRATYTTSALSIGDHVITAAYSGDSIYEPSSATLTETIIDPSVIVDPISGSDQVASEGDQFTKPLVVKVSDPASNTVPNVPVSFGGGGLSFCPSTALTNSAGEASTIAIAKLVGPLRATATVSGVSSAAVFDLTGTAGAGSQSATACQSANGFQFLPVTPCRVADTRNASGAFGGPKLAASTTREFDIPQSGCNIPSTAVAYSLNVTVLPDASLSYLTAWPSGQAQPNVSTLNSDGRVKANAAIMPAGSNGGVSVYVSDASHVILDIDGYFVPAGTASALAFYPLAPCRVADTRNAASPLGGPSITAQTSRDFPIQASSCSIPPSAQAYSLNVTALPHHILGYLTSWPTGQTQPNVSTLNSSTGAISANAAIVPAGSGGSVSIYVSDDADVILDINGYFAPPASAPGALSLYTTAPCRVLDTRSAAGPVSGVFQIPVQTSPCALPSSAQEYVVNATVVPSGPLEYISLWADGQPQPNVSTLNAYDGAITSNLAIVPTSNGAIDIFTANPTQVIVDTASYFAP